MPEDPSPITPPPPPPPINRARRIGAIVLAVALAAAAAHSITCGPAFHRAITLHRIVPAWPGFVLPVTAAACVIGALIVNRVARSRWLTVTASLVALVPVGWTSLVLYDHVDYGPHNSDTGAARLQQIGIGLLLYSSEHGHALPPDLPAMVRAVGIGQWAFVGCEYAGTTTDETEPERVATMIQSPEYNGFTYVGGGQRDDAPPDTVVAFSRSINGRDGGDVLYADGSVSWLTDEAAQYIADHARNGGPPIRCRPSPNAAWSTPSTEPTTDPAR